MCRYRKSVLPKHLFSKEDDTGFYENFHSFYIDNLLNSCTHSHSPLCWQKSVTTMWKHIIVLQFFLEKQFTLKKNSWYSTLGTDGEILTVMVCEKKAIDTSFCIRKEKFGMEYSRKKWEQEDSTNVVIYLKLTKKFSLWCWGGVKIILRNIYLFIYLHFCDLIPSSLQNCNTRFCMYK